MNKFNPKSLREKSAYSQVELADLWGVGQATISRWEQKPEDMKRWQKQLYLSLKPKVEAAE